MILSTDLQYPQEQFQNYECKIKTISNVISNCAKDRIAFIFIFGSFGNRSQNCKYISNYNFLIITRTGKQANSGEAFNLERKIEKEFRKQGLIFSEYSPNYIIESINLVNSKLGESQYFFSNIKKAGILIYDSGEFKLSEPEKSENLNNKIISKEYYNHWMSKAEEFYEFYHIAFKKGYYIKSIFELHQTTESLYNCVLLALVGYKPKSHDLIYLSRLCSIQSDNFLKIFPLTTDFQKKSFELLQKSYIDARYNKNFSISKDQLEYLITRVKKLKLLVKNICKSDSLHNALTN